MSTDSLPRRRSLSEGSSHGAAKDEPEQVLSEPEAHDTPLLSMQHESLAALERRSRSESFIRTAQGIIIQDTKGREYHTRLDNLVQLAADASSSESNVLLAKKALRYRKVLERR